MSDEGRGLALLTAAALRAPSMKMRREAVAAIEGWCESLAPSHGLADVRTALENHLNHPWLPVQSTDDELYVASLLLRAAFSEAAGQEVVLFKPARWIAREGCIEVRPDLSSEIRTSGSEPRESRSVVFSAFLLPPERPTYGGPVKCSARWGSKQNEIMLSVGADGWHPARYALAAEARFVGQEVKPLGDLASVVWEQHHVVLCVRGAEKMIRFSARTAQATWIVMDALDSSHIRDSICVSLAAGTASPSVPALRMLRLCGECPWLSGDLPTIDCSASLKSEIATWFPIPVEWTYDALERLS